MVPPEEGWVRAASVQQTRRPQEKSTPLVSLPLGKAVLLQLLLEKLPNAAP